jgi:thioesterase domain-containing protein
VYLQLNEAKLDGDIVLAEGGIRYHSPIKGAAHAQVECQGTQNLLHPLQDNNKARIKLEVKVFCGDNVAATFTGTYFILPKIEK